MVVYVTTIFEFSWNNRLIMRKKSVEILQQDDLPKKNGDYEFGWRDQLEDELFEVL